MSALVRHTAISPSLTSRIAELVVKGAPPCIAGTICGVNPGVLSGWLRQGKVDAHRGVASPHAEFHDAVEAAEASCLLAGIETVAELMGPDSEPGVRLRAATFLLTHRFPQHFQTRTEVTGARGAPLQAEARAAVRPLVSDEALARMTLPEISATIMAAARVAGLVGERPAWAEGQGSPNGRGHVSDERGAQEGMVPAQGDQGPGRRR